MPSRAPGPSQRIDLESFDNLLDPMRQWVRDYGDLVRIETTDDAIAYVVCHPEHVGHILAANHANYTKGYGIERVRLLLGGGLMVSEDEVWLRHRSMLQPLFRRRILNRQLDAFVTRARALRDRWAQAARSAARIDVTTDTSDFALLAVLDALFGADAHDSPLALVAREPRRDLAFALRFRKLRKAVGELVERRRADGAAPADLLSMMIAVRDAGGGALSTAEIVDEAMTLVVAGHETTASALAWVWSLLADNPDAEARLHQELDAAKKRTGEVPYAMNIIKEALRLYPPGWVVTRQARGADTLGDVAIEPRAHVFIPLFLLHRHPRFWTDPEAFRPERFSADAAPIHAFAYLPFAAGRRRCIGEMFALVEMQCHLVEIASALQLRRAGSSELRLDPQVNLRMRDHLWMTARPRMHA